MLLIYHLLFCTTLSFGLDSHLLLLLLSLLPVAHLVLLPLPRLQQQLLLRHSMQRLNPQTTVFRSNDRRTQCQRKAVVVNVFPVMVKVKDWLSAYTKGRKCNLVQSAFPTFVFVVGLRLLRSCQASMVSCVLGIDMLAFQTRLLLTPNKPCLLIKEALFGFKRSLVWKPLVLRFVN